MGPSPAAEVSSPAQQGVSGSLRKSSLHSVNPFSRLANPDSEVGLGPCHPNTHPQTILKPQAEVKDKDFAGVLSLARDALANGPGY